jgi:HEPN domain-containing protein
MPPERRDPRDPHEWLRRARGNLAHARVSAGSPDILYEDLCFDAQQAAEKAIKAVLISRRLPFPRTHVIVELLTLVHDAGIVVPSPVRESARLTRYAVQARYPGAAEDVTAAEHSQAVAIAETVVRWAQDVVGAVPPPAAPG